MTLGDPAAWHYVQEGGANLVLSSADLSLRLPKLPIPLSILASRVQFQSSIIRQLFSPRFSDAVPDLRIVELDKEWLKQLQELVNPARSAERREIHPDISQGSHGILMQNFSFKPLDADVLMLELKPKWGFIAPDQSHCRFCMHHYHRHAELSDYCPLSLYSADPATFQNAIQQLYERWTADAAHQNNFRLVYNELPILQSEIESLATFLDCSQESIATTLSETIQPSLTPLLQHLSSLQKSLDGAGIHTFPSPSENPSLYTPPSLEEWQDWLSRYSSQFQSQPFSNDSRPERHRVLAYILSMTIKDLSILIRLVKVSSRTTVTIHLVDLDEKPITKFSKWQSVDTDIKTAFQSVSKEARRCI